jgi:hypothetical protein
MNKRQALKRLADPKARNRILDQFNRENLDDVASVLTPEAYALILYNTEHLIDQLSRDDPRGRHLLRH